MSDLTKLQVLDGLDQAITPAEAFSHVKKSTSTQPAHDSGTRVRTSERALRIAIKGLQEAGIPIQKICVTGSQIEIHCGSTTPTELPESNGLEKW